MQSDNILKETKYNLIDILNDIEDILIENIDTENINLISDVSRVENPNIICDKAILEQILIECLGNAVKYTGDGGAIELDVAQVSALTDDSAMFEFAIRDTGMGMNNVINSELAGTKRMVDMMHGEIIVESEEGIGTEVIIKLPFKLFQT
jgi:signal transduction histidine kinase